MHTVKLFTTYDLDCREVLFAMTKLLFSSTKQGNSTPSDPQSPYMILHYHLQRHGLVACLVLKGYAK